MGRKSYSKIYKNKQPVPPSPQSQSQQSQSPQSQSQQSQSPPPSGLLNNLLQGAVMGAGMSVGQSVMNSLSSNDNSNTQSNNTQPQPIINFNPLTNTNCEVEMNEFQSCLNKNQGQINFCKEYLNMLDLCRGYKYF